MRGLMVAVGGVLLLATAARGLASFDLPGTARVGERPEANAVVWLEASAAPAGEARHVVLDQRNLVCGPRVLAIRVGRLPRGFTAQANLRRQSGNLPTYRPTPVDLALTRSFRIH